MDIQRKAFEAYMADRYKNTVDQRVCINSDGDYMAWDMQVAWHAWQAAKAQAVPEGFVLVKASDRDQEMLELIDQRDHMESQAEQLKDKLQNLYGVDFGEHSNCNFPFQNAIDFDDSDLVLLDKKELRDTYYWDGSEYVVDHPSEYEMELERGEITTLEKWQRTKETNVYCANIYSNEDDFKIVQFESLEEAKKAVAANKAMIEAQEPDND